MQAGQQLFINIFQAGQLVLIIGVVIAAFYVKTHEREIYSRPRLYPKKVELFLSCIPFLVPWAALIGYFIFPLKADFSVYVKRVLDVWPLIILCIVWTLIMVLAIHYDLKLRKKYGGDP